ncbi:MAG: hypothetical protein WCK34_04815, partial [Bacteroidota bacterium]
MFLDDPIEKTDIFAISLMKQANFIFLLVPFVFLSCQHLDRHEARTVFRYNEAAGITTLDPAFARDQTIIWAAN